MVSRRAFLQSIVGVAVGGVGLKATSSVGAVEGSTSLEVVTGGRMVLVGETGPELIYFPDLVQIMAAHPPLAPGRVYCDQCDADAFPTFGWLGDGHIAVRLWDTNHELRYRQMPTFVTVDGVRQRYALEAVAGDPGWLIREIDEGHWVDRRSTTCITGRLCELIIGRVELEGPSKEKIAEHRAIAREWLAEFADRS